MKVIREALKKVSDGVSLTESEAREVMSELMSGSVSDAQIAALLVALKMKGETTEEIVGFSSVMREKATRVRASVRNLVDTCGTGGDSSGTFNVSTAAAFVVAGMGVPVAKHGNRAISSSCGSADVLEALGVKLRNEPEVMALCIERAGIGFLFAPALHPAMKHVMGPRKELGMKTVFNILGPLTNPAGARRQLLGVFSRELTVTMANVLKALGAEMAFVVHGADGTDEFSITGPTYVVELNDGELQEYQLEPGELGLKKRSLTDISGGSRERNAQIIREVLSGESGPHRDVVLLNAAAGAVLGGKAHDLRQGLAVAAESIDSGKALHSLQTLISVAGRDLSAEGNS
jgi:anthranilate phosphoribosyltransferase